MSLLYRALSYIYDHIGTQSPKLSMLGVQPTGFGRYTAGAQLTVGFGPDVPDYAQIAVAASSGWAWGVRAGGVGARPDGPEMFNEAAISKQFTDLMEKAVRVVLEEKRCAVIDCALDLI